MEIQEMAEQQLQAESNAQLAFLQQQLAAERAKSAAVQQDIATVAGAVKRLLTDVGMMQPDGSLQFKPSALTSLITKLAVNPSRASQQFSYLGETFNIVKRYQ